MLVNLIFLWIGLVAAFVGAVLLVFSKSNRHALVAFWILSFGVSAFFVGQNREFLAIAQILLGTVFVLSGLMNVISMGHKGSDLKFSLGIPIAGFVLVFCAVIFKGLLNRQSSILWSEGVPQSLMAFGREIVAKHFVSLQLVALMVLIILMGMGWVSSQVKKNV